MAISFLTLLEILVIVSADISHLFPNFGVFHQPQAVNPIYGPPPINFPTLLPVPEVIVNRKHTPVHHYLSPPIADDSTPDSNSFAGYFYDEPTTTTTSLTLGDFPGDQDTSLGYGYHPPSSGYLPSQHQPELMTLGPEQLHIDVKKMRCMNSESGFFRVVIKIEDGFIGSLPVVDQDSKDTRCEFKLSKNYIAIDLEHQNFNVCGVKECSKNLCLRIRFPLVSGLKSASDNYLTLQCKPQMRVVAKSHAFKVGVATDK